jgi:hypothetical protein
MPFQMPQDFIYLGRTMGILSGMSTSLDPTFNPWEELQPYTQKMILQRNGSAPSIMESVGSSVLQSLLSGNGAGALLNIGQTLLGRPAQGNSDAVLARIERGDLKLTVEPGVGYKRHLERIEAQSRKTKRAVIFGSLLIASTLLYTNGDVAPALVGYGFSALALLTTLFGGEG